MGAWSEGFPAPPEMLTGDGTGGPVGLRLWADRDATALARAWADPEIASRAGPGDVADPVAAANWIAGVEERRRAGRSLDWVVVEPASSEPDRVRGEVGLWRLSLDRAVIEVGWWTGAEDRGRGLATDALGLALGWVRPSLRPEAVVARIVPGRAASERVAEAVGLAPIGQLGDGRRLWRAASG